MKEVIALICLSVKQVLRSRYFLIGCFLFYCFIVAISFLVSGSGPKVNSLKFYVTVSWILVFAFSLGVVLFLPLRFFAKERESRISFLMGTRPVSRLSFILARFLACLLIGFTLLGGGCLSIWCGAKTFSMRSGIALSSLSGCIVIPAPPKPVSELSVDKLARDLSRDTNFLKSHGVEGVRRIALLNLSMYRLKEGDETRITWKKTGLASGGSRGARIHYLPRIYPPWSDVKLEFRVGGNTFARFIDSGRPDEIVLPGGCTDAEGNLTLNLKVVCKSKALVYFSLSDGFSLYVPGTSFAGNLARAGILLFIFLAAMTTFGILSSAVLSYPVGVLVAVLLVVVGLSYPLLVEAAQDFTSPMEHHHEVEASTAHAELISKSVRYIWQQGILLVLKIVPDFEGINPLKELVDGRIINFVDIGNVALNGLLLRGGTILLLAWFLFSRQELGKRL